MLVNNLPKVATQWNSGTTWESNPGPRVRIPSALTTKPMNRTVLITGAAFVCPLTVDYVMLGAGKSAHH